MGPLLVRTSNYGFGCIALEAAESIARNAEISCLPTYGTVNSTTGWAGSES
ncbi:hypothetical protein MYFR107205_15565 [Mycolicibacterium frederiksbergense]